MARRSDHTQEELKELAVEKALEIIDEKGAEGFSARGVAAAMGYSPGTLYHVFGDIDSFLLHVHGRILDEWHADLARGLGRAQKDPLKYLAHAYLDFARRHHRRWSALFAPRQGQGPLPDWYAGKMARLFGLVEEALRSGIGGSRAKARKSAKVLWAGIHGICVLSLSGKLDTVGTDSPEALIDALIDTWLRGLRKG
jgi:AcrR family transcriptional regulator